jgi:outer membrane immunogenic protein
MIPFLETIKGLTQMLFKTTSAIALSMALGLTAASAADLPSIKGPAVFAAPIFTWTGFYVGGSLGYIQQNHTTTQLQGYYFNNGDKLPITANGGLFSVNAGYNYQMGSIVLGVETDIGYSTTSAKNSYFNGSFTHSSKLSSLGTVRARLGYAVDRALFYATGGFAYAGIKDSLIAAGDNNVLSKGGMRYGWAAGGGIEYAVTNNWTVRAEALYAKFNSKAGAATNVRGACSNCRYGFKNSAVVARAGVNYKF